MTSPVALEPCPFCGSAAISPSSFDVKCLGCGAEMPGGTERASAAWNRRAPLPADLAEGNVRLKARTIALAAAGQVNDNEDARCVETLVEKLVTDEIRSLVRAVSAERARADAAEAARTQGGPNA